MFSSSGACLNGCSAEHFHSVLPDPSASNLDASGGSVPADRGSRDRRGLSDRSLYSAENTGSRLMCSNQLEVDASRESCRITPPGSLQPHHGWSVKSSHQAKRARVENIIKGITCSDVTTHPFNQEDEGIQELLHQKHREKIRSETLSQNQVTRKEVVSQHQHLRTEFSHTEGEAEDINNEKEERFQRWHDSPEPSLNNRFRDSSSEFERRGSPEWMKVKLMNYFQCKPDRIKLMADVLKYELSRAVSSSVDSIFKSLPLLQTSASHGENSDTAVPLQATVYKESKFRVPCWERAEVIDVQTEALSLVIQKPNQERPNSFILESSSPCVPKTSVSPRHESALHVERHHSTEHQLAFRGWENEGSEVGRWNPFNVKSKVNSISARSPQTRGVPMGQLLESLSLPHVKVESDNMEKTNLYMLNECLTSNHLKKAKLMFFYTRYPSSLVLRMCFHDVQFNRCITSQLIKWFSNFREFYYIQMEKFARNALLEGVADVRHLTVDRESEIFRALNVHYNKANDFQVPERFLEVAEITLREFYIAISMGKDHDPSWKKAIYKVICKLDSDVPAEFKRNYSG